MYRKVEDQPCDVVEYHDNGSHCSNVWLGLIFFVAALQCIVVVGAGITGYYLYDANQEDIQAWINLPWQDMALSVQSTYITSKDAPIHQTILNAYQSTSKLKSILNYHDRTTLKQFKLFSDLLVEDKNIIRDIHQTAIKSMNAMHRVNMVLRDQPIDDFAEILHKTRHMLQLFDDDELRKSYNLGMSIGNKMNVVMTKENVEMIANGVHTLSVTANAVLTASNINRTLHVMEDFDSSLHRAENTVSKIGLLLGSK